MVRVAKFTVLISLILLLTFALTNCSRWQGQAPAPIRSSSKDDGRSISTVAFTARQSEPTDAEIRAMVDEVIEQVLGPKGLAAIIKPGDKVVIKTNIVAPNAGKPGEKGRGIITDPRIARYVAEKVRAIIGTDGTADLKMVDATFSASPNPSKRNNDHGFFFARLEKNNSGMPDEGDYGYDMNADGILDGDSKAKLVNLDAISGDARYGTTVTLDSLGSTWILLPKMLRTREQAHAQDPEPKSPYHNEYCDVLIGLPILKSHGIGGITGALKLHYGFRWFMDRFGHSGTTIDPATGKVSMPQMMDDYMVGQHLVRSYDFILMDCLTGNRAGPGSPDQKNETPVDYILTHAMTASTDPVAMDTVEALFGGYDPKSIGSLTKAAKKGLGTNQPERIRLLGSDAFGNHRQFLLKTYAENNLYPFRDSWGVAKVTHDFDAPTSVTISKPEAKFEDTLVFYYTAGDSRQTDTGLARIELLANGKVVAYKYSNIGSKGMISVKRAALPKGEDVKFQIAAWDKALNCAVSR